MSDTPPVNTRESEALPETLDELRAEVYALRAMLFQVIAYGFKSELVSTWEVNSASFVERGCPTSAPMSDIAKRGEQLQLEILGDILGNMRSFGR